MAILEVAHDDDGRRVDRILRTAYPGVPPGAIAGAIRKGAVRINGARVGNESRVVAGDRIEVPDWHDGDGADAPAGQAEPARRIRVRLAPGGDALLADHTSIPILDRTEDWLALAKPQGLASHGTDALDEIVRAAAADAGWWRESLSFRPGPVHRLDRNTSGVQLFSLSAGGARLLTEDLRRRNVFKVYLGIAVGAASVRTSCTTRLAWDRATRTAIAEGPEDASSKLRFASARTTLVPVATNGRLSLVAAIPETGRTHQVRCHMAAAGLPLAADVKYGGTSWDDLDIAAPAHPNGGESYFLHAWYLASPAAARAWHAPFPPAWFGLVRSLFGDTSSMVRRLRALIAASCTECPDGDTLGI